MKTKVFPDTFNGKPMFKVFEVDENGEKIKRFDSKTGKPAEPKHLLNIGTTKCLLIQKHIEEFNEFIDESLI